MSKHVKNSGNATACTSKITDNNVQKRSSKQVTALGQDLRDLPQIVAADGDCNRLKVIRGPKSGNSLKRISNLESGTLSSPKSQSSPKSTRASRAVRTDDELQKVFDSFEFDYFQAVLPNSEGKGDCKVGGPEERDSIARAIRFFEENGLRSGPARPGGRGYVNGLPYHVGNDKEAVGFLASGSTTGGMPNVTIKGGNGLCAGLAPELQLAFPGLRATRIDVCLDVIGETGTWDELLKMSEKFTRSRKVAKPEVREGNEEGAGRTFYVGSRESSVFLRVYEKGKAENKKLSKNGLEQTADNNWIRIEFQHQKIEGHKKAAFADMTPDELMRARTWPRFWVASAAKVVGLTEAVGKAAKHKAKFEPVVRTLEGSARWGVRQYGPTFLQMAINKILNVDYDGDFAVATMTEQQLVEEAVDIFRDYLASSGKAYDLIHDNRFHERETSNERTSIIANLIQEKRIKEFDKRSEQRFSLAEQVLSASEDNEGIQMVLISAADAENTARDAHQERRRSWETVLEHQYGEE